MCVYYPGASTVNILFYPHTLCYKNYLYNMYSRYLSIILIHKILFFICHVIIQLSRKYSLVTKKYNKHLSEQKKHKFNFKCNSALIQNTLEIPFK